jgi:hypothetical protein
MELMIPLGGDFVFPREHMVLSHYSWILGQFNAYTWNASGRFSDDDTEMPRCPGDDKGDGGEYRKLGTI